MSRASKDTFQQRMVVRPQPFDQDLDADIQNGLATIIEAVNTRDSIQEAIEIRSRLKERFLHGHYHLDLTNSKMNLADLEFGNRLGRTRKFNPTTQSRISDLAKSENQVEYANLLADLGNRYLSLGRKKEACEETDESVRLLRIAANCNPRYEPALVTALDYHSCCLFVAGREDDALETCKEAVNRRRGLQERSGGAEMQAGFVVSSANASRLLLLHGNKADAYKAAEEALQTIKLIASDPCYDILHAETHCILANVQASTGRWENAGISVYTSIPLTPLKHHSALIRAYTFLSKCNSELGRQELALDYSRRAAEYYKIDPDRITPSQDFALALCDASDRLSDLEQYKEALDAIQISVNMYGTLSQQSPSALAADHASSLRRLSRCHFQCNDKDKSYKAIKACIEVYNSLDGESREEHKFAYASSLHDLVDRLESKSHHRQDAYSTIKAAVDMYRPSSTPDSPEFRPKTHYVVSLDALSRCAFAMKDFDDAVIRAEGALHGYGLLERDSPLEIKPRKAAILSLLSDCEATRGRGDKALAYIKESVRIYKEILAEPSSTSTSLFSTQPTPCYFDYISSLVRLSRCHLALKHDNDSLEAIKDAVSEYESAKTQDLVKFKSRLAEVSLEIARCHLSHGQLKEADGAANRSKAFYRGYDPSRLEKFREKMDECDVVLQECDKESNLGSFKLKVRVTTSSGGRRDH